MGRFWSTAGLGRGQNGTGVLDAEYIEGWP